MAKGKKHGQKSADVERAPPPPTVSKDLQEAIGVFAKGDYARARSLLKQKASDPSLPEGAQEHARELMNATKIERGTLYVGLACIALFILVIVVTSAMQT